MQKQNVKIYEERVFVDGTEKRKFKYSYVEPITNRKIVRVCKDCKSMEDAKKFVSKIKIIPEQQYIIKNITKNMYVLGSEHLKRLESFGKKLSIRTIEQKRQCLDLIERRWGDYYINKIKLSEIESYLLNDEHSGSWKNSYLETFCSIFDETQWLCDKPVMRLPFKKFARNSHKADLFSTEELNRFFQEKNFQCKRDYILFLLTFSCGLRIGETLAIRVNQIDFEEKILIVNGFFARYGERLNYNKGGSNDNLKIRIAIIPEYMIPLLKDYVTCTKKENEDFLFTDQKGYIVRYDVIRKRFINALYSAGINKNGRKMTIHSLRFTYVTRMRRNASVETVQKLVGHADIAMTEYYTRFGKEEMIVALQPAVYAANKLLE